MRNQSLDLQRNISKVKLFVKFQFKKSGNNHIQTIFPMISLPDEIDYK